MDAAIDRWVWYAGWSDKIAQVYGNANPVAGPYFNLTTPEPTGVVGIVAPPDSSLLGLVSVVAPVIVTGNTCVVLASEERPLPAITLAEVLATSDLPGGVVNLLTGRVGETAPWLAGHMDVNAHRPDRRARRRSRPPSWSSRRRRTSSGCCARASTRTGTPTPAWPGCWPSWSRRRSGTPRASNDPTGLAGHLDAVRGARRSRRRTS